MNDVINDDGYFMGLALSEARRAGESGEVPVGAVAVLPGRAEAIDASEARVIAAAGNRTIRHCDPTAHAEIVALRAAAKALGNHRLAGVALYVTIEPCAMCAGAIVQARIARVIYGADDPKGGAVRSCFNILDNPQLNHKVEVVAGVRANESAALLQEFFSARR
jgi:tRNA(adenine34) deaminase